MKRKYLCSLDNYYPDRIYVLKKYADHDVTQTIIERYPKADVTYTERNTLENEIKGITEIGDMIEWGKKTLFIGETQRFISQQRGQSEHYCKGPRKIIPMSNGCHFSCEYCFMQGTYRGRHPRVKFNLNWDRLLQEIDDDIEKREMLGTQIYHMGENQDSLSFDYLYPLTKILVPFFSERDSKLLLLSKSDCVDNLLGLKHNGHTIVSWSMNSDYVTRHIEHDSAPLQRRIESARKVQEEGYPLRLRFDPLLLLGFKEWEKGDWKKRYDRMTDAVFKEIKPERITLGSLRFHPTIKAAATQRFPDTRLFSDQLINTRQDEDGRYRYKDEIRAKIYKHVVDCIREKAGEIDIGLCKETAEIWNYAGLHLNKKRPTCHCQL